MKSWFIAVKLQALPKIILPSIVGFSLLDPPVNNVILLAAIGLFFLLVSLQWTIVFLNDFADKDSDKHHATKYGYLFDLRVLPTGLLRPNQVFAAGIISAVLVVVIAYYLFWIGRWHLLPLAIIALFMLWAYSYRPIRLNYRGGGELLEAAGTGFLLPIMGAFTANPDWSLDRLELLLPVLLYAFISAMVGGLKHEPADKDNGKKTLCVMFGAPVVRRVIWILQIISRVWCVVLFFRGDYGIIAMMFGVLATALPMYNTRRFDSRADYRDLVSLRGYKKSLQQAGILTYLGLTLDFLIDL